MKANLKEWWHSNLVAAIVGVLGAILIAITTATLCFVITIKSEVATLKQSDEQQTREIEFLRDYTLRKMAETINFDPLTFKESTE